MAGKTSEPLEPIVAEIRRPKYLDLFRIRLPLPGLLSIMHRVSGFALFVALPVLLWLLQSSLSSPDTFIRFRAVFSEPLVKLILIGLLWGFLHHLFAGVRFLFLDVHRGVDLKTARATSAVVIVAAAVLALLAGIWLW